MRLLVDSQLPVALARFLEKCGVDCAHVLDVGLAQAGDSAIWRYAVERGMTLVSKDEDFFQLASRPGAEIPLIWVRLGNCRKRDLLLAIERVWPRVRERLEAGERIVEIR